MLRILVVLALILVLVIVSVVIGSAASLEVGGGVIQVFSIPVTIEIPDCTHSFGQWKNHPDAWPAEEIAVGGVTYSKAEVIVILDTEPGSDATYILAHQLIATKLNLLRGADASALDTTVGDADEWLGDHPPLGSAPSDPDRAQGIALAETLDEYNTGVIGPGACED